LVLDYPLPQMVKTITPERKDLKSSLDSNLATMASKNIVK